MFAVIKTGGKQYRVAQDEVLTVEKLDVTEDGKIEFAEVLMVGAGADVKVDLYRQATSLRLGGGSPGLDPMNARVLQVGLTHRF